MRLWTSLALTVGSKLLTVVAPLVLADAINRLSRGNTEGFLPLFLGLVMVWSGLRFGSAALPQIRDAIFAPVSQEAQRRAGAAVFAHVHSLSVSFHATKRTGAVFRTIERGIRAIDFLLRFLGFNIGPTLLELTLAALILTLHYSWMFGAMAAAVVFVYAWLTFGITEWRLQHRREMNEADTEASGRAVDSLINFETVKAFTAEKRETERFDRALAAYAKAAVRSNTSLVLMNVVQGVVMNIGLACMVGLAGWMAVRGQMGPGDVTAIIMYMLNIYAPLNFLGFSYREIKQSAIDIEKMFALLDEKPEIADAPNAVPLKAGVGEVRFEDVSFSHEGRDRSLEHVSFVCPAGKTTAIVGPSGAGKSTVLKLLFRFFDPASGRVAIDGQDVKAVTQDSLREALGLVPQDVVLFNDTIRYNIAYGAPEADFARLRDSAGQAQLLEFIESLPHGWETRVGERGLKISGGEKQRVGIARVMLKDPPILILDEATSSLDSRTEAGVQEALEAAARGRTTIVVAHRLSTIAGADQIVVLKDGRVAEIGRHADLVARGGEYAELWRRQAEEPEVRAIATAR
ncbi:MAG TPA: ABC transporter ATP-binding protein/permease [Caulobacterales bacterium]|nr:ABC transporter ATP-binding protein/permease [Caulobacterales bacterium]